MTTTYPYVLNLDSEFQPVKNGVEILSKSFTFHGGEPHFQITSEPAYKDDSALIITQRYNKIDDLFKIVLANDAARRMGFKNIELVLPYFPAARQDRVCNEGEPLTIKVFAEMINGCGFDKVTILCPHSEVTPALLNNVVVLDELQYVNAAVRANLSGHEFNIVCPDAGAGKRVGKIVQYLSHNNGFVNFNLIRCEKVRDVKDGSLKEFFVQADDLKNFTTLICDDINSMAGTFIGLGKVLREKNCGKLMLFTSHSDCVNGIQRAVEFFDHVFTTNSKRNWGGLSFLQEKITCFNIEL